MAMLGSPSLPPPSLPLSAPRMVRAKSLVRVNAMYHTVMSRLQRQKSSDDTSCLAFQERSSQILSLESLMSFGLGSGPYGEPVTYLMCSNYSTRALAQRRCPEQGLISCHRVSLPNFWEPDLSKIFAVSVSESQSQIYISQAILLSSS